MVVEKYDPILGTLNIGITGTMLGFYEDNGKEMETTVLGLYNPRFLVFRGLGFRV